MLYSFSTRSFIILYLSNIIKFHNYGYANNSTNGDDPGIDLYFQAGLQVNTTTTIMQYYHFLSNKTKLELHNFLAGFPAGGSLLANSRLLWAGWGHPPAAATIPAQHIALNFKSVEGVHLFFQGIHLDQRADQAVLGIPIAPNATILHYRPYNSTSPYSCLETH